MGGSGGGGGGGCVRVHMCVRVHVCMRACVRVHECEHEDENSDNYDGKIMMANVKHLRNWVT